MIQPVYLFIEREDMNMYMITIKFSMSFKEETPF